MASLASRLTSGRIVGGALDEQRPGRVGEVVLDVDDDQRGLAVVPPGYGGEGSDGRRGLVDGGLGHEARVAQGAFATARRSDGESLRRRNRGATPASAPLRLRFPRDVPGIRPRDARRGRGDRGRDAFAVGRGPSRRSSGRSSATTSCTCARTRARRGRWYREALADPGDRAARRRAPPPGARRAGDGRRQRRGVQRGARARSTAGDYSLEAMLAPEVLPTTAADRAGTTVGGAGHDRDAGQPRGEMYLDEFKHQLPDIDEQETTDWIRSLDDVVDQEGETRARFLLFKLLKRARQLQVGLPPLTNTRYINTISPEQEPDFPGDEALERRIRRLIRWNAVAMVLRANTKYSRDRRPPRDVRLAPPRSTRSASTGSSRAARTAGRATRSSTRATPRRASTPAPSSRAGSARSSSTTSGARRRRRTACRPTRTRGSCPTSGSSRRSRWASARSTRSTRPGSTATSRTAASLDTSGSRVWAFLGDGETDEPEALGALHVAARRGPRQPDLRRQLQPAAPRRPGPRQRQDHPGARGGLPRLGLERDQGDLGPRVGRAPRPRRRRRPRRGDERHGRRRVPEVLGRRRRLHPGALLRAGPAAAAAGRAPDRRRPRQAPPRRPRLPQGLSPRTSRRSSTAAPRP